MNPLEGATDIGVLYIGIIILALAIAIHLGIRIADGDE